jgi:hypothetical protein
MAWKHNASRTKIKSELNATCIFKSSGSMEFAVNDFRTSRYSQSPSDIFTPLSSQLISTRLSKSLHAAFPSAWRNTFNQDQIVTMIHGNSKSFGSMELLLDCSNISSLM